MSKKLPKIECEICGCKEKSVLHKHHIIERTEINTTNNASNLLVLCANCHNFLHNTNKLKIIGIYPSTKLPYGRTVIYELDGKANVDGITKPYYIEPPKYIKIPEKK